MRETSRDTYKALRESGALHGSRLECYGLIAVHGPMPLFDFQHFEKRKDYGSTLAKRVSELVSRGLVMAVGEVANPRSGRTCTLVDVTSRTVPLRLAPKKSEIQELRSENVRLRRQLKTMLHVHAPRQQELIL